MKKPILTFLVAAFIIVSTRAMAEAPCTAIGHETLQGAIACANSYARSKYLDSHNRQMMQHMSTQSQIPPQTYPMVGGPYYPYIYYNPGVTPYIYKNYAYWIPRHSYAPYPFPY